MISHADFLSMLFSGFITFAVILFVLYILPIILLVILVAFEGFKDSRIEPIMYTIKHKKAFLITERILFGKNTLYGYLHDLEKIFST